MSTASPSPSFASIPFHFLLFPSSRVVVMAFNGVSRLANNCTNVARTWKYAIKYRAVDENYRFEKMGQHHLPQLMDLAKRSFADESVTLGTGATIDDCRNGMEYVFAYAIAANAVTNISDVCYDKKTNKPIGFRMIDPYYRDPKTAPFSVPEPTLSAKEATFFNLLDGTLSKIWERFPDENVILKPTLLYVDRLHRKNGLYQVWIDYGVDFATLAKQTGANVYASMCTSRKTKGWREKLGYELIYTSGAHVTNVRGETVSLPEGEIRLYATDMKTTTAINVKPCWEKMKACGMMTK